ncbi:MAG: hypothetical protein HY927_13575 [Elusimicrobia bacterium]|nr:hypothetical protein [Elusimicrobiota bacterium]
MTKTRSKPAPSDSALRLGWRVLASPTEAARSCLGGRNLAPSLWIYAACLAAFGAYNWLKPPGFPAGQSFPVEDPGLGHSLQVALWNIPLEAGWIVFLMGLARFFESGTLIVRMVLGVAWAAASIVLLVLYAELHKFGKGGLLAGALAWLGLFYPLTRRVGASEWLPLASFMLAINAIAVVLAAPLTVAALARAEDAHKAAQVIGGLWLLGASTLGLRELRGMRLSRAFMAIFLTMVFQVTLSFTLYFAGLAPREILMALFSA